MSKPEQTLVWTKTICGKEAFKKSVSISLFSCFKTLLEAKLFLKIVANFLIRGRTYPGTSVERVLFSVHPPFAAQPPAGSSDT